MIKYYNGLPLFSAEINEAEDGTGVYCVSFVTNPATEMPFFAFDKNLMKYSIIDDKERIVTGVIMLSNTPIFRVDDNGDGYYIVYTKDTLKLMAEKMLKEGFTSSVNIEHRPNSYVDSVNLQEIYIIDREKGIDPQMFKDAPDGSLIGTYKVRNDEVWEKVLNGEVYSFSLEGYFEMKPVEMKNNNNINNTKMKNLFKKLLVKFASVETDKGTLYYADELAVGVDVFVDNENVEVAADGEYETEDKVIVVADGKVAEIREKEVEQPEPEAEPEVEVESEEVPEPEAEPEPVADPNEERIAALEEKVAGLESEIAALKDALAKIVEQPQAEPVEEEFENVKHKEVVGLPKAYQKSISLFKK